MKQEPNLISFLNSTGPDKYGRYLEQVLKMNDEELEKTHNYIQWLFPLTEPSAAITNSPVLTNNDISIIRKDPKAQNNLMHAMSRMLQFYDKNDHWIVNYDHNHLRITRIIKSLNLLSGKEVTNRFFNHIMTRVNTSPRVVSKESISYWNNAFEAG